MDLFFKEEHEVFRKEIRAFVEKEIAPLVDEAEEKNKFPVELLPKMGKNKFLCVRVPKEYGGRGGDKIMECIGIEEVTRVCAGMAGPFTVQGGLGLDPILRFGSDDLKKRYLIPAVKGEKISAFGLTEPDAGSDAASLRTTAEKKGDGYVLNGTKTFITNCTIGDFTVVAAYTDVKKRGTGINLFVVDRGTPGFSIDKKLTKLGIRSTETGELSMQDCWVPKSQMIGDKEGGGFDQIEGTLKSGRISVAARCIGIARSIMEDSLNYVKKSKERAKRQAVRFALAEMAMQLDAITTVGYRGAWLYDHDQATLRDAAVTKLFTTETLKKMVAEGMRLQGEEACLNKSLMQRYLRDSRVFRIVEGTSEVQHLVIFNSLEV